MEQAESPRGPSMRLPVRRKHHLVTDSGSRPKAARLPDNAILGLDVGGAHLKAVHAQGESAIVPFPLWRDPNHLTKRLRQLFREMTPFHRIALTMTGELCDCFANRPQGVSHILNATAKAAGKRSILVWCTKQRFLSLEEAAANPWAVASANWLATGCWAGRWLKQCHPDQACTLFMDFGSTTLDLVPIVKGRPEPNGLTDFDRLQCGELIYLGATRTPVMLYHASPHADDKQGWPMAAEWFASLQDVYVLRGDIAEDARDTFTADGRPRTRAMAEQRLARQWGADRIQLSKRALDHQVSLLAARHEQHLLEEVLQALHQITHRRQGFVPTCVMAAGSGEFLLRRLRKKLLPDVPWLFWSDQLGSRRSSAAAAEALIHLAHEQFSEPKESDA